MNPITSKTLIERGTQLLTLARELRPTLKELGVDARTFGKAKEYAASVVSILPRRSRSSAPVATLAFGAGFVAGATATALVTPMSGPELRNALRTRARDLWQGLRGSSSAPQSALDELDDGAMEPKRHADQVSRKDARQVPN